MMSASSLIVVVSSFSLLREWISLLFLICHPSLLCNSCSPIMMSVFSLIVVAPSFSLLFLICHPSLLCFLRDWWVQISWSEFGLVFVLFPCHLLREIWMQRCQHKMIYEIWISFLHYLRLLLCWDSGCAETYHLSVFCSIYSRFVWCLLCAFLCLTWWLLLG